MEWQYHERTPEEIRKDDQRLHEIFMKTNPGYIQFHTAIDKIASLLADGKDHTANELQEVMVSCGYTEKGAKRRLGAVIKAIDGTELGVCYGLELGVYRDVYVDYDDEYGDPIKHTIIYRKASYYDFVDWDLWEFCQYGHRR